MRFELRQRFAASPNEVDRAYTDPDLFATLVGLPKLGGIRVLDHHVSGDQVKMRVHYSFTGDLPAAVTAVVDPERLTWVQESAHDLSSGVTTFRLVPDHYPDRLKASGKVVVSPLGNGAQRVLSGELKVRALLVAGAVEGAIVSGLGEYLDAEAPAVDRFLKS